MSFDSSDELNTDLITNNDDIDLNLDLNLNNESSPITKKNKREAEIQCQTRKRIEDLLEQKRLREQLDDEEDW